MTERVDQTLKALQVQTALTHFIERHQGYPPAVTPESIRRLPTKIARVRLRLSRRLSTKLTARRRSEDRHP